MSVNKLWADNNALALYKYELIRRQMCMSAKLRDVIDKIAPYALPSSPSLPLLTRQSGFVKGARAAHLFADVLTFPVKALVGDGRQREVNTGVAPADPTAFSGRSPSLEERRAWLNKREALRRDYPADEGLLGLLSEGVTRVVFSASSLLHTIVGAAWAGALTLCLGAVGRKARFEDMLARSHVHKNPYVDFLSGFVPAPIFLARKYTTLALQFGAALWLGAMPVQAAVALSYGLIPLGLWLSIVGWLEPVRIAINVIDLIIVVGGALLGAAIGLGVECADGVKGWLYPPSPNHDNDAMLAKFMAASYH